MSRRQWWGLGWTLVLVGALGAGMLAERWPESVSWEWALAILLVLLLSGLLIMLVRWSRRHHLGQVLRDWWAEEPVVRWGLLLFSLGVLIITIATWLIERDVNEHFADPLESFWSITIYLLSGLEDRTPYHPAGRVVATFGLLLGPIFFAVLTGWLARFFMRWEKRMPKNLKDHYLLLNWSERAHRVIQELHSPLLTRDRGAAVIVVLTDDDNLQIRDLKAAGSGTDRSFEDVFLSVGDPTSKRALKLANAQDADTIIILSDDRHPERSDERSLRSLAALRCLAREECARADGEPLPMRVVVEITDAANETLVAEIARDFPGQVEVVSGIQVRTCLLAQAALGSGVVDFYSDLLRVSDDTNEVYSVEVPSSVAGHEFRSYAARVLGSARQQPLIPLGIQRRVNGRTRIFSNPRPDSEGGVLQSGDRLVLLAYGPPKAEDLPTTA